jgi:hypothetical protein
MISRALRTCLLVAALVGACESILLLAQTAPKPLAVTRISEAIDESHLVSLQRNVHPLAQPQLDLGPASGSLPVGRSLLVLKRSAEQQQALEEYLAEVENPASPSYRKWLTPAQFGATYGLTDEDMQAVEGWLESHGLKIEKVPQARNAIAFSGSVDQVQAAFHTAIHSFLVNGEQHYANIGDLRIPAALAPVVAGVWPLNDFRPKPQAVLGGTARFDTATHSIRPQMTLFGSNNTPYLYLVPADAAAIYDTPNAALNPNYSGPTYDGTGIKIGIAGDSNVTMQDIENYRIAFLGETASAANLPTVVIDGNDPGLNSDEVEALLDTEIAGGIAPKAKLYLYTSDSGLFASVLRALDDNVVSILNISFGGCESAQGTSGNAFMLEWAEQAAAQGISVTVSSGDSGSANCDRGVAAARYGLAVNGIASTPWTIAVGGTDFDSLPANFSTYVNTASSGSSPYYRTAKSYIPEEPWNDSTTVNTSISANVAYKNSSGNTNIVAAGGGASSCVTENASGSCLGGYAKPSFQTSLTPNDAVRDLPDVSLFASNGFYQAVWTVCSDNAANEDTTSTYTDCQTTNGQLTANSTFSGYGGTSTSAPAFAGMLALVSQAQGGARLGQADFVLYQLAKSKYGTVFHDTTTGDNSVVCVSGSPNCGSNGFMTGYNASTGYDEASGLGSVDVAAMVANWSSVSPASTSTTLNINGSSAAVSGQHGTPLTFNVAVTPASATGAVGIVDTANENAGGTLNNGQFAIPLSDGSGSATYNGLPGGSHTVSARYSGDTADAVSSSTPINVTITPENSAVTISGSGCFPPPLSTLCFALGTGGGNLPIPYGSGIGFEAQIAGTSADELKNGTEGVATGTVTFAGGNTILGTVSLGVTNQVSWPTLSTTNPYLPVGSYNVTAQYSGDSSFNPSTSPAIALNIVKGAASTNISSVSSSSIPASGSATITVQVGSLVGVYPTGTVTLTANGSTLATITSFTQIPNATIQGTATIQASQLAVGPNTITATYSGDGNYASSSSTVAVTVTGIPAVGFTLGNSGDIAVTPGSGTATSTIAVTPTGGFTGRVNLACAITSTPGNSTGVLVPISCNIPSLVVIGSASAVTTPLTVTAPTNTTAGAYVVTISGTNASTGQVMANNNLNVTVGPAYGFALNNSGNLTVTDGDTVSNYAMIAFTAFGGFAGTINTTCAVTTSISNPAAPPTCTFPATESIGAGEVISTAMFVNTTSTTTPGSYLYTVTGTDAATGKVTASTGVNVSIVPDSVGYTLSNSGNIAMGLSAVATSTITVTPFGGFTGQAQLTCSLVSGLPYQVNAPICTTPSSVTITGSAPAMATLTITTNSTTTAGNYTVTIASIDSATSVPAYTTVQVTVTGGTTGFTLVAGGNIVLNPGVSATSTITAASTSGFTGQVNLTCAVTTAIVNPVDPPTCVISSSVNILSGTSGASTQLTVNTTAPSSAVQAPPKGLFLAGGGIALCLMVFAGIPSRRRRGLSMLGLIAMTVLSAGIGCGGGSTLQNHGGSGTTAGAYTVTITGTDAATGKLTASTTVSVTVN